MFEFNCIINRVIDGDTMDVDIDLGFDVWLYSKRVRLMGVDAAESRTRDKKEDAIGEYTRDLIALRYPSGTKAVLISTAYQRGKYGRIIGDVKTVESNDSWLAFLQKNELVQPEGRLQSTKTENWHLMYEEMVLQGLIKEIG